MNNHQMPFTLGSNQCFNTFPCGAMQNEIQILLFFVCTGKKTTKQV